MIPTIGIIIGAYVILRSIDLICRSKDAFASQGARMFAILCAIGMILISSVCTFGLAFSGLPSLLTDALTTASDDRRPSEPPKRTPAEEQKYRQDIKEMIRKAREEDRK